MLIFTRDFAPKTTNSPEIKAFALYQILSFNMSMGSDYDTIQRKSEGAFPLNCLFYALKGSVSSVIVRNMH
jgi:hypothetical protein